MPRSRLRIVYLLIGMALVSLLLALFTPVVQSVALRVLLGRVELPVNVTATVDRVWILPNGRVSADGVAVHDADGERVLGVDRVRARVRVRPLFSRELFISDVEVDSVAIRLTDRIERDIERLGGAAPVDRAGQTWAITVDRARIDPLSVSGIDDVRVPDARVLVQRVELRDGTIAFDDLRVETDTDLLVATGEVSVAEDGEGPLPRMDLRVVASVGSQTLAAAWPPATALAVVGTAEADVRLVADGDRIELRAAEIDTSEGVVARFDATVALGAPEAHVELSEVRLPLRVAAAYLPDIDDEVMHRELTAAGSVRIAPDRAEAEISLSLGDDSGSFDASIVHRDGSGVEAVLDARSAGDAVSISAAVEIAGVIGPSLFDLDRDADQPLRVSGPVSVRIDDFEPIRTIAGVTRVDLDAYVDGQVDGRLRADRLGADRLRADVRVALLRVDTETESYRIDDLHVAAEIDHEELSLELSVDAVEGGAFSVEGVAADAAGTWPEYRYDLTATVVRFGDTVIRDPRAHGTARPGHIESTIVVETVEISLSASVSDAITADVVVTHDQGRTEATVSYDPSDPNAFLTVELASLDLSLLRVVAPDQIAEATGALRGRLAAGGSLAAPILSGSLSLVDAVLTPTQSGVDFALTAGELSIDDRTLRVGQLRITDPDGGSAVVDGRVDLGGTDAGPIAEQITYDMTVRSDGIMLLKTDASDNPELHGTLRVGGNAVLRGSVGEPEVEGSLEIAAGSDVTVLLPRAGLERGRGEGIVRFTGDAAEELLGRDHEPLIQGVDLTGSLSIAPDAQFTLVIDPRSGDRLRIQGGGDFSIGIDRGGAIDLSGTYTVQDGSYQIRFLGVIERDFRIDSGGTIAWAGSLLDAEVDFRAEYAVRTSPAPILSATDTAVPGGELPFIVAIEIDGTLLSPLIAFEIDMPIEHRSALGGRPYTAVSNLNLDEARRNTQAFALIVLNQFLDDDLAGIDDAGAFAAGARGSLSDLLAYQLNLISARILPGLDVAFGVDSFEAATEEGPEGRTEVQVQLSQRLLDDRLIVRFGGQVEVERAVRQTQQAPEVGGDASVEYALTDDGRFRLRLYVERDAGDDERGAVTGLSFVFGRDFDPFDDSSDRDSPEAPR
ncbi:MAG: hypothetical protein EA382_13955 [Spirochaetaceae bacterium]|nr:MAG: hypothetical protein EA382_13955 [Spirochaetaceae bacterium]